MLSQHQIFLNQLSPYFSPPSAIEDLGLAKKVNLWREYEEQFRHIQDFDRHERSFGIESISYYLNCEPHQFKIALVVETRDSENGLFPLTKQGRAEDLIKFLSDHIGTFDRGLFDGLSLVCDADQGLVTLCTKAVPHVPGPDNTIVYLPHIYAMISKVYFSNTLQEIFWELNTLRLSNEEPLPIGRELACASLNPFYNVAHLPNWYLETQNISLAEWGIENPLNNYFYYLDRTRLDGDPSLTPRANERANMIYQIYNHFVEENNRRLLVISGLEIFLKKQFTQKIDFSKLLATEGGIDIVNLEEKLYLHYFKIIPEIFQQSGRKFFKFKVAIKTRDIGRSYQRERLNRVEARARIVIDFIKEHPRAFKKLFTVKSIDQKDIKAGKIEFSTPILPFGCLEFCQAYSNIYYSSFMRDFFAKFAPGLGTSSLKQLTPFINIAWVSPAPESGALSNWGVDANVTNRVYQWQRRIGQGQQSLQQTHTERLRGLEALESPQVIDVRLPASLQVEEEENEQGLAQQVQSASAQADNEMSPTVVTSMDASPVVPDSAETAGLEGPENPFAALRVDVSPQVRYDDFTQIPTIGTSTPLGSMVDALSPNALRSISYDRQLPPPYIPPQGEDATIAGGGAPLGRPSTTPRAEGRSSLVDAGNQNQVELLAAENTTLKEQLESVQKSMEILLARYENLRLRSQGDSSTACRAALEQTSAPAQMDSSPRSPS